MKGKRRIEITRYSRRVTVLEGRDAADAAAVPHATDMMADVLKSIPPAPEKDGRARRPRAVPGSKREDDEDQLSGYATS